MKRRATSALAVLAALSFVAASCGSDEDSASDTSAAAVTTPVADTTADTTASTTAESTEDTATASTDESADTTGTTGGEEVSIDTNGDGKVIIGVATPGPRDDGGYYQALVDGVTAFSEAHGYEAPIIVDNIPQEEAATQLDALARQNVDMIAVGAGEIGDPLNDLTEKYADIIWYCNCGAGHEELPNLIQSGDDGAEMGYSAGVATGLLMQDKGTTKAAMIGNNNFPFEVEAFKSFELGLHSIDPAFEWTYVATNDFNDVAAASEAFNNLKETGVGAIWPYLGGAHEAVVKLSNENDIITMSAGASDACERPDLTYDIAVRFDAGDYLDTILGEILDGSLQRGETRAFHVGVDPQGGAVICDPTPEQTAAMDKAYEDIASGSLNEQFGAIKAEAYAS
jgi:basic membrane protein A